MRPTIQTNFPDVARRMTEMGRQGTYAAAVALTRTAQDVRGALRAEMEKSFDRPTKYTLNSLFLKRATKTNLEAVVWLKDNPFGKGTSADRYLKPHIEGGGRSHKGMERALQRAGLLAVNQYAVPAAGAQIDDNGNVKRSQIVQIMSQLKVQLRAGYESKATGSTRSRRTIAKQGVTYFAVPVAKRGLMPGIYLKRKFALGSAIRPVFIFVGQPAYKPRFRFFEVGDAVVKERFPGHFHEELIRALATAEGRP